MLSVLVVAVVVLLVSATALVFGPVDPGRLGRFALRQHLLITPDNGNIVIRYLATTRRWRGGLLYLMLVASVAWLFIADTHGNISGLNAFVGWFVGAVIAEWRVDALARGPRSAALLHRRRIDDYVRRPVLALVLLVWLAVPVLASIAVAKTVQRSYDEFQAGATLAIGLLAGAGMLLVARRVLHRPQPLVAPDLLEADNAIRGRSLNVLAGSAIAIGGYLGAVSVGEVIARPESGAVHLAQLLGYFALPILGVIVARAPRRTPMPLPVQPLAA